MLIVGHRGASAAAPENTPEAFRLAAEMGADGVELDVRRAPDGRLVVKHDPFPPVPPASQGSTASPSPGVSDDYPGLGEVLESCGSMLVNVEIKNSLTDPDHDPSRSIVEATIEVMRQYGGSDRWIISSFDWETVGRCREVAPDIATAFLVELCSPEVIERTAAAGHAAVHPWEPMVTLDVVDRCHRAGLAVTTWTCNDPVRIAQLAELGVDGVCTDVPDIAIEALGRRGTSVERSFRAAWGRPA